MSKSTWQLIVVCEITTILVGATSQAADPIKETSHAFEMKIDSQGEQEIGEKKQSLNANSEVCYTWHRRGRQWTLSYDSLNARLSMDGNEMQNTILSREKFVNTKNGKKVVILAEQATIKLKEMLEASFKVPLCAFDVDENGDEIKRTIVAGRGADLMLKNGAITNACLFHAPFPLHKDEWSAKAEMALGTDALVTGSLNYKKVPGAGALQVVIVSGVLTNDSFIQPGTNVVLKETRYVVKGKQSFDTDQREWVVGDRTVDVTYRIIMEGMSVGSGTGKITLTFKQLPTKTN